MALVRHVLARAGIETERLALEWASAAEAVRFVELVSGFINSMKDLGPINLDAAAEVKLKAARISLESTQVRMALARHVRNIRKDRQLPAIPTDEEIVNGVTKAFEKQAMPQELLLHLQEGALHVDECARRLNCTQDDVVEAFSRLTKKNMIGPDRLVTG